VNQGKTFATCDRFSSLLAQYQLSSAAQARLSSAATKSANFPESQKENANRKDARSSPGRRN